MNFVPKQNVLVPFDFSDMSVQSLETALKLVESPAHVHVLHVLPDMQVNEPGMVWGRVDNESRTRHAEQAMRDRLNAPHYAGLQFAVEFGDPGHEIAEYADKHGTELIVISSHGRTGWKRVLIGSVAERVVRLCHCPVLVLRPPKP